MAVNSPHIEGVTTIVWGTGGLVGSPAGAIVESVAMTPRNGAPIGEIEDGNGASVTNILLDDGFDAKVVCVNDTSKTWPTLGSTVVLTVPPYLGGAGALTAYSCFVAGNHELSMSRKKEATITMTLRYRPGIAPA